MPGREVQYSTVPYCTLLTLHYPSTPCGIGIPPQWHAWLAGGRAQGMASHDPAGAPLSLLIRAEEGVCQVRELDVSI